MQYEQVHFLQKVPSDDAIRIVIEFAQTRSGLVEAIWTSSRSSFPRSKVSFVRELACSPFRNGF